MKHVILVFSTLLLSLNCVAQMEDKFWVLFGAEAVKGTYTGISPQVTDDQYKLLNLMTFRMEMMSAKGNAIVDVSSITMWLFNRTNDNKSSSLTEREFHKVQNKPALGLCVFKLIGDESSDKIRIGFGGKIDWRRMGLSNNSDNNGFSAFGAPGLSYGPLESKVRGTVGANVHLVKQTEFLYARVSMYGDYCPGKLKGFSVYPEATVIANIGQIALFGSATYRTDFISGNRQTATTHTNQPQKTTTVSHDLRLQIGIGFDLGEYL